MAYRKTTARLRETIPAYRKKAGYTIAKTASLCEMSKEYYQQIEAGKVNVSVNILDKIANVLDCDVCDLVFYYLPN